MAFVQHVMPHQTARLMNSVTPKQEQICGPGGRHGVCDKGTLQTTRIETRDLKNGDAQLEGHIGQI